MGDDPAVFATWEALLHGEDPFGLADLRPDWMNRAACRSGNAEFFPVRGEHPAAAKTVCRDCTVRDLCLDYALDNGIKHGVWGGTSERERRTLRAKAS